MRTVYLIRHGEPDFPDGKRFCLSRTDLPLTVLGRLQACLTASVLPGSGSFDLFSSPLLRARETASFIGEAAVEEDLSELGVGEWEGLSFDNIREKYPEEYAQRGVDPFRPFIPGGEPPAVCRRRMLRCIDSLLGRTSGDIAVVSHACALKLYLSALNIVPAKAYLSVPMPYAGVTKLILNHGVLTPEYIGEVPRPPLDRALCLKLLAAAGTPQNVIRHSLAVEKRALYLAADRSVDRELIRCGALLHDMMHTQPYHEKVAADLMDALGYTEVASLILSHTDLPEALAGSLNEASLIFLADKTVSGETVVSLEERFSNARKKCTTVQAQEAHARRYTQAQHLMALCGERL